MKSNYVVTTLFILSQFAMGQKSDLLKDIHQINRLYYVEELNTSGKQKQIQLKNQDSIALLQQEFDEVTKQLPNPKLSLKTDTVSRYKLAYIVENREWNYMADSGGSFALRKINHTDENNFNTINTIPNASPVNENCITGLTLSFGDIGNTYSSIIKIIHYYVKVKSK